jgi:hypothetical protein
MSQKTRRICTAAMSLAAIALTLIFLPKLLQGFDAGTSASPGKFIVHEWGTFTSFSGSSGVNLEFRPLATNDLPRFIMTPFNQPGSLGRALLKDQFYARQRMETPVAYFYTDAPRTVSVRVDFPQGALTEWYPVVKKFQSGKADGSFDIVGRAFLDWGAVHLTPPKQFAKIRVKGPKQQGVPASLPPVDANDHYGRARETDSAIVETIDAEHASHFEKFLFYRGLGNFELPMKLAALGNDRFEITNSGEEASGALLLMRIENGLVRFTKIDPIGSRSMVEVTLPETESTVDQLTEATVRELTAAGLYEKESLAMVNTWRCSWFGENGTRVLYLVPGKQTDKLLPLKVEPAPDEQVRVLVGRLETITPEDCEQLVVRLSGNSTGEKPAESWVKEELKSLGRFAEPAIKFAISQTNNATQADQLKQILTTVRDRK